MSDADQVRVTISSEQMEDGLHRLFALMDELQDDHDFTIDQVIAVVGYAVGYAIRARGGILSLDEPLRNSMPIIVLGYMRAAQ